MLHSCLLNQSHQYKDTWSSPASSQQLRRASIHLHHHHSFVVPDWLSTGHTPKSQTAALAKMQIHAIQLFQVTSCIDRKDCHKSKLAKQRLGNTCSNSKFNFRNHFGCNSSSTALAPFHKRCPPCYKSNRHRKFTAGNFSRHSCRWEPAVQIHGTCHINVKWFNCHSAEVPLPNITVPKHEGSPPKAQQALPVCSSTPTNPMSRADTHRRASTFSANRIRSRVFASLKQPAQKKTHQIPRISDMLFHKDTYTEAEQTNL